MIRIAVQAADAEKIRLAEGPIELVDEQGLRIGFVRRPPTDDEIAFAKSRIRNSGQTVTIDELISKVEAL